LPQGVWTNFFVRACTFWVRFSFLNSSLLLGEKRFSRIPAPSMNYMEEPQKRLWIRDRDSLGNIVDQRLIDAAYRVWERARLLVIRYLTEDMEAPEILEAIVESASRAMHNGKSIEFFDAYLLTAVAHEAGRRSRKYRRLQYVDRTIIEQLAGYVSTDIVQQLDDAQRIELLRACMDERGRTMFDLRVLEYDWRLIAKLTQYADAHSAEVQFNKKMHKALQRFRTHDVSRLKPRSRP
jgi:DNA-directed RNA polymerase specialized sigma24 family protein